MLSKTVFQKMNYKNQLDIYAYSMLRKKKCMVCFLKKKIHCLIDYDIRGSRDIYLEQQEFV